jgi:hypothetical protein
MAFYHCRASEGDRLIFIIDINKKIPRVANRIVARIIVHSNRGFQLTENN